MAGISLNSLGLERGILCLPRSLLSKNWETVGISSGVLDAPEPECIGHHTNAAIVMDEECLWLKYMANCPLCRVRVVEEQACIVLLMNVVHVRERVRNP